jgi:hypothetical protein
LAGIPDTDEATILHATRQYLRCDGRETAFDGVKMTRKVGIATVGAVLCLMAGSVPASAGVVTLSFNSLASGADSTAIKAYIDGQLAGNATVTVSGGAVSEKGYNGDGHVVGVGASTVSRTLGTSEGNGGVASGITCTGTGACTGSNLDTWIRNAAGTPSFYFDFSNNFIIDSVSFDYEIFPDGTCTSLTSTGCGGALSGGHYPNQPDFTFSTDLGQVFHSWGTTPSGSNTHSPVSGAGNELTPQLAPVNTGLLVFNVAGSNKLTFADWPATIGIDNLIINWHQGTSTSAVPEPASLLLLGTGLIGGLRARARRRQRSAS